MPRFVTVLSVLLVGVITYLGSPRPTLAQDWTGYSLRDVDFAVPSAWQETFHQRDQEFDFTSPDGRFTLWARWWFADEPLLGYPDIVGHDTVTLAGQQVLFIHTGPENERMLQLAFQKKDSEGEQFLFQLSASEVPLDEHRQMLETLIARLVIDGVGVVQSDAPPAPSAPPAPDQTAQPSPMDRTVWLPTPQGWDSAIQDSAALQFQVHVSPQHDRLVLAAVAWGNDAQAHVDEVLLLLYRDSVIVKSIDDEYYPVIAGTTAHAVQTTAKVFAITGIELPYARAKVGIFQGAGDGRAFMILTVRDQDASETTDDELERIATGLLFEEPDEGRDLVAQAPEIPAELPPVTLTPTDQARDTAVPETDPDGGKAPVSPTKKGDGNAPRPQLAPAPGPDPVVPAPSETAPVLPDSQLPETIPPSPSPTVLFDGSSQAGWLPFAFQGGDYASHATITGTALDIMTPDGLGWAKTGLRTAAPIIHMPDRDDTKATRIAITIDTDASNSLAVALTPAENTEADPWEGHDLQLHINRNSDGSGAVTLHRRDVTNQVVVRFTWPTGPTTFQLILRPDQVLELRTGTGERLAWFALSDVFANRDWVLQVYLRPVYKNHGATLSVQRVVLDQAAPVALPDIDLLVDGPRMITPFDGTFFTPVWQALEAREHASHQYMQLEDGALRIAWPEETGLEYLGLFSPEAALWLDRFGDTSVVRIRLTLDGAASGDFEFGLRPTFALSQNRLQRGDYRLSFTRQENGTFLFHSGLNTSDDEVQQAGLTAIPDTITLVLTRRGIAVDGAGLPTDVVAYPLLRDGVGLRLFLYALKPATGAANLVVKSIEIEHQPEAQSPVSGPAEGVIPLPPVTQFDGKLTDAWTPMSQGGALFDDLATNTGNGLSLTRRAPPPDHNRIALVSTAPLVTLDTRLTKTPFDARFTFDATQDNLGARILFSTQADRFRDTTAFAVTLRELQSGPNKGRLQTIIHVDHFYYDHWTRILPAGFQQSWDGNMTVSFSNGRVQLYLGDTAVLSARSANSVPFRKFHIAVVPGGIGNYDSGQITLRQLETGWRTPDRMSAIERMQIDNADVFDPAAFVDLLVQDAAAQ